MSSAGVPEQSLTTGLVGAKLPATGVLPTLVYSSSLSEKLDYPGDDNIDWDNVHPAPDTSKYSHLAGEEMQEAISETESPFGETTTIGGILFYLSHRFSFPIMKILF